MSQKCCSIKDFGLNGKILRSFNAKSRNFLAVNFNKQQFMLNLLHGLVVNTRNSFILSFLSAVKLWLPNILVRLCLVFYSMFTGKSRLLGKPETITMRLFLKTQVGRFVIKELVHAFSCATTVMDALKKFVSPNFPRAYITRYTHGKHEIIL